MNSKAHDHGHAHWLMATGLLDKTQLDQASLNAREQNLSLVKYLVDNELLDSASLAAAAASAFGLPLADLDAFDPLAMPVTAVTQELVRKYRAIPLYKHGKTLLVGLSDPACQEGFNDIRFQSGCKLQPLVIEEDKLNLLLQDLLDNPRGSFSPGSVLEQGDFDAVVISSSGEANAGDACDPAEDTPVMRLVNKILADAIRQGASDIHIEHFERSSRIRFRQDGLLREIARPPPSIAGRISARLKVMARLNIAEKRLPQDGRFKLSLSRSRATDFRVNTLPTLWGEKTVLRLLDPGTDKLDLDLLGYTPDQKRLYTKALHRQQGLILITGPTGSGKSLSLYAGLNQLNTPERNIATVEDPVEIHLEGINQVAVNPQIGLDFAQALRAFLRQDPDVLMVGEIRDIETARIAIKAAQTGHLVMSTLHTNSAPETVARLLDMGIAPYHLASSLSLIIAQRLLRRLCNACKKPLHLPAKVLIQEGFSQEEVEHTRLFAPTGCSKCHSGYRGRVAIFETVAITEAISRGIMNGENSIQIAELSAKAGFNSLRRSALEKAAQGLTSLAEVNKVT